MGDKPNPIEQMMAKFNRAADFEVKRVRGVVEEVGTLEEGGKKIYIVHIANGKLRDSFWLAHDAGNPYFSPPMVGESVSGTINTFDDNVDFAGDKHKPIFDFQNISGDSERDAFAWFAQHGERFAKEAEEDRKRDDLYRKLGLDRN